jgi:hypothetical protein
LETELHKLQSYIGELCDTFDTHLQDCQTRKINAENLIFIYELKIIKMRQLCVLGEDDEMKGEEKLETLALLKRERDMLIAELPDVKV